MKAEPNPPKTVEKASATSAVETLSEMTFPVFRSTSPLDKTAKAVREQTMIVSDG